MAEYVGHDELVVLDSAVNYNRHIADRFAAALPDRGDALSVPVVVDFGAGIGTISRAFRARTGIAPLGVELDARQRTILESRGFQASESLDHLPDESVDLVFSSNVIEHIEDDVTVLRHLRRKLRPGGRLALWIPAFPVLWSPFDDRVEHYRRYTMASAKRALSGAGFTTYPESRYQDSLGFFATLAFKWLGNKDGVLKPGPVQLFDRIVFPVSKILDIVCHRWLGKNIYIVAVKQ
jgi:SAM-dependent methyltransferase